MKITVSGAELQTALSWLTKAVPPSQRAMPALSGIRLHAADGTLEVGATDIETFGTATAGCAIDEPGTLLAPRRLAEIVARLPNRAVSLAASDGTLEVRCGRINASVPLLTLEDLPRFPGAVEGTSVFLPGDDVRAIAGRVAPLADRGGDKVTLTGVHLKVSAGGVVAEAASNHYAAQVAFDVETDHEDLGSYVDAIVPTALFDAAAKLGDVTLTIGDGWASVDGEGRWFASATIDGTFPNIDGFFQAEGATFGVEAGPLLEALGRCIAFAGSGPNPPSTTVEVEGAAASLSVALEGESYDEAVDVGDAHGVECAFRVHAGYLAAGVKAVGTESALVTVADRNKPVRIEATEEPLARAIVMPRAWRE